MSNNREDHPKTTTEGMKRIFNQLILPGLEIVLKISTALGGNKRSTTVELVQPFTLTQLLFVVNLQHAPPLTFRYCRLRYYYDNRHHRSY